MSLIPQNSQSMEQLPYYRGQAMPQPGQRISKREQRAIEAQDEAFRVGMHGLERSEDLFFAELETFTRCAVGVVKSHSVIGQSVNQAEAAGVEAERRWCEYEPGAIPRFSMIGQQLHMQRGEFLDAVGQELMRKLNEAGRLRA